MRTSPSTAGRDHNHCSGIWHGQRSVRHVPRLQPHCDVRCRWGSAPCRWAGCSHWLRHAVAGRCLPPADCPACSTYNSEVAFYCWSSGMRACCNPTKSFSPLAVAALQTCWAPGSRAAAVVCSFCASSPQRAAVAAAGKQAEVLNILLEDLLEGQAVSETKLKEVLGHTPIQVAFHHPATYLSVYSLLLRPPPS